MQKFVEVDLKEKECYTLSRGQLIVYVQNNIPIRKIRYRTGVEKL